MASSIAATMAANAAWAEAHGESMPIARTELYSVMDGTLIVSTVILAAGFTRLDGPFVIYETRIFGGRCDGHADAFGGSGDHPAEIRRAMERHKSAIDRTIDSYLPEARLS
jgi:hypothetical protein